MGTTSSRRQLALNVEEVGEAVTKLLHASPRPLSITLHPYGVIMDDEGKVKYNAFQQDGVVLEVKEY